VSPDYLLLVNVGGGAINAITGKSWSAAADFKEEDYGGAESALARRVLRQARTIHSALSENMQRNSLSGDLQ